VQSVRTRLVSSEEVCMMLCVERNCQRKVKIEFYVLLAGLWTRLNASAIRCNLVIMFHVLDHEGHNKKVTY
jgi:hypothetical protein